MVSTVTMATASAVPVGGDAEKKSDDQKRNGSKIRRILISRSSSTDSSSDGEEDKNALPLHKVSNNSHRQEYASESLKHCEHVTVADIWDECGRPCVAFE